MVGNAVILGIAAVALYNDAAIKADPPVYYVQDVPGGFNALTLPPVGIFIHTRHRGNVELLQHEIAHWRQYQRDGLLPFWGNYISGHLLYGYDGNPYEVDVRTNECDYCRANYTECVRNGSANTVHDPGFRL